MGRLRINVIGVAAKGCVPSEELQADRLCGHLYTMHAGFTFLVRQSTLSLLPLPCMLVLVELSRSLAALPRQLPVVVGLQGS